MHELDPRQLPLPCLVHKDRREADIMVDEVAVVTEKTYRFLKQIKKAM